jgi:diguanylate cyclase (GGDEF)-like protein
MADPTQLENAILRIIRGLKVDDWVQLTLGTLRNRLSDVRTDLGSATDAEMVDCMYSLEARDLIAIRKSVNLTYVPFARPRAMEEMYRIQFFWHGSFELKITHEGKKVIAEPVAILAVAPNIDEFDDLGFLFRKKLFEPDRERFVKEAMKDGFPLALVIIDVDNFGQFNKKHNLEVGDEVLKAVFKTVQNRTGTKGNAYRYGGDEIAILLPNYSKPEAIALAETMRVQVEESAATAKKLKVTITLGVAALPEDAHDGQRLFNAANEALLCAKKLGRNLVRAVGDPDEAEGIRTPTRKQPQSQKITEDQLRTIRMNHFRGGSPICPTDGALLRVKEFNDYGTKTPTLLVTCPGCGLQEFIMGD